MQKLNKLSRGKISAANFVQYYIVLSTIYNHVSYFICVPFSACIDRVRLNTSHKTYKRVFCNNTKSLANKND